MKRILLTAALVSGALAAPGAAQTNVKDRALENYIRTGKLETCVPINAIRETTILGESSILFRMAGGTVYLNELPQPCPALEPRRAFTYVTSLPRVCNTDVITVTDPGSSVPKLGACGLGQFELLTEKPAAKTAK